MKKSRGLFFFIFIPVLIYCLIALMLLIYACCGQPSSLEVLIALAHARWHLLSVLQNKIEGSAFSIDTEDTDAKGEDDEDTIGVISGSGKFSHYSFVFFTVLSHFQWDKSRLVWYLLVDVGGDDGCSIDAVAVADALSWNMVDHVICYSTGNLPPLMLEGSLHVDSRKDWPEYRFSIINLVLCQLFSG